MDVVFVAGFKIMKHGRNGQSFNIIIFTIPIYREINDGQKGKSVYILLLTNLFYSFIAKAKINTKRPKALQNIIIILYNRD